MHRTQDLLTTQFFQKRFKKTSRRKSSTLEQLSKMGVLSVTLSGGESMCNLHSLEYLRAAKKYDFYVNILSNLTLLTDEIVEAMKEGNVSSVQVSLYSLKPEIHDYITKLPDSCEKSVGEIMLRLSPLPVGRQVIGTTFYDHFESLNAHIVGEIKVTDFHVHIGQWKNGKYFYPQNVFAELKSHGVDEVWF